MFLYITGQSLYFYIFNKWPTRGLWNKLNCVSLCAIQVLPPQLVLVIRISHCQPGVENLKRKFLTEHIHWINDS